MGEKAFFEGWYFKQQSGAHTVAFIPAHHRGADGAQSASLQIITETAAYQLDYPIAQFHVTKSPFSVAIGDNRFSLAGCHIDCAAEGVLFRGGLCYSALRQPRWDIMGPFRFAPLLQCRHSLQSIFHGVAGRLQIAPLPGGKEPLCAAQTLEFRDGTGYIEGDRGSSFPRRYLWTQCTWAQGSVMLSVADIPFYGLQFMGCIAALCFEGKIRRFASYLGAKILYADEAGAAIRQGDWMLSVRLKQGNPTPLRAPAEGAMSRTIYESAACTVCYRLEKEGKVLFDFIDAHAGFESEWGAR